MAKSFGPLDRDALALVIDTFGVHYLPQPQEHVDLRRPDGQIQHRVGCLSPSCANTMAIWNRGALPGSEDCDAIPTHYDRPRPHLATGAPLERNAPPVLPRVALTPHRSNANIDALPCSPKQDHPLLEPVLVWYVDASYYTV
jgi:hypothetical protein